MKHSPIAKFQSIAIIAAIVVLLVISPILGLATYPAIFQKAHAATVDHLTDFNGDGFEDLAIGVPGESISAVEAAGAVNVIYGSGSGLSATSTPDQFWHQGSPSVEDFPEEFENFGRSLGTGDFNGDGYSDLAVSVPGENDVGAVNVIYGSSSGLSAVPAGDGTGRIDQIWKPTSANVEGEFLGGDLATGDFNGDGYCDLAIGAVETTGGVDKSAVNVIYGSSSGLSAVPAGDGTGRSDQIWTQDTPNVEDDFEEGDGFASALTSGDFNGDGFDDLAIGAFDEQIGSVQRAGGVNVIYGSSSGLSATSTPDQFWTQASPGVEEFPELGDCLGYTLGSGDFNGDGYDDLAIGVKEDGDEFCEFGTGAVNVIYGSSGGLGATAAPDGSGRADQLWHQNIGSVEDVGEPEELFGASISSGDFNNDGYADMAVGVTRESIGSTEVAGAVNVLYGSASGLSATSVADQLWNQGSPAIEDFPEEGDGLGSSLHAGDFNSDGYWDLAIGVPNETVGTGNGAVNLIYGSSAGLRATAAGDATGRSDQLWHQDTLNVEDQSEFGDSFGTALA